MLVYLIQKPFYDLFIGGFFCVFINIILNKNKFLSNFSDKKIHLWGLNYKIKIAIIKKFDKRYVVIALVTKAIG